MNIFSISQFCRRNTVLVLCIILFTGLLPRLFLLNCSTENFLHNDGKEYKDIARQISKGNGFSISFYRWYEAVPDRKDHLHIDFSRPPVFPLLGAALFFLPFDWDICARITVMLLSILCSWAVYLSAAAFFKNKCIGLLASAIFTFYPFSLYYSVFWASENLFLFFLCLAWYFMIRSLQNGLSVKEALFSGGMSAAAMLTRPQGAIMFLLIGAAAAAAFFINRKKDPALPEKLFKATLAFCTAAIIICAPWMVRNAILTGTPSPFSFYGPYSFAQASSDVSYETYRYIDTPEYAAKTDAAWKKFHAEKTSELKKQKIFSLPEAAPYWRSWAWDYIKDNPEKTVFIVCQRLLHCFRIYPNRSSISPLTVVVLCLYFAFFAPLFFYGIWLLRKNKQTILLLIPILSVFIMAVPFLMIIRYRYPFFAPFASMYAAYALYTLWGKIQETFKRNKGH